MYGDDDYSKRDSRPLSFITSPLHESMASSSEYFDGSKSQKTRPPAHTNGNGGTKLHSSPGMMQNSRSNSFERGQLSPSLSLRERSSDTAKAPFPLNDIDYESNPAAVAQELSNLQALRRMSMDVGNTSDPDLPSFQGVSLMPSVAPTGNDDEDDPSRLFWVPARVHPELAPMEFKTFLENRVQSIKRRSGEQTALSPDGGEQAGSGVGLRRKKSMLSRQINNDGGRGAVGYKDGAEQLERKKSLSADQAPELKISDLQELDALVRDPTKAMRKLTLDTNNRQLEGGDMAGIEDMPILPQAPGIGLRRSTRTTYRRGSLRKGDRAPFNKRAGSIKDTDGEESPISPPNDGRAPIGYSLTRVQSEPIPTENFSRPTRGGRRLQNISRSGATNLSQEAQNLDISGRIDSPMPTASETSEPVPQLGPFPRSNSFPRKDTPVPRIIETPPPPEEPAEPPVPKQNYQFPERSSSQSSIKSPPLQQHQFHSEPPPRSSRRPTVERQAPSPTQTNPKTSTPSQTLNEMAQHPSPLPGGSVRTDTLTFIPTLDERKPEKKSKKDKDDSDSSTLRKPSWGIWFKGGEEKDKKDRKKEEDQKESKRSKVKVDKAHDSARLDVLQSTLEAPRGRESLLLDRDSLDNKLLDERKKESSRKTGGESKKEKDRLFSSFFGGKKKSEREVGTKKGTSLRTLSPDPPHRILKADVDYNWTRFSILEERAIYRMAHIKLANPRRALYSQVLLSNFMYSYLAKVQQMHPQMQLPSSAVQKKEQEEERRRKEQELLQQHQQDAGDQYRYDYHQGIANYAETPDSAEQEGVNYVDDSQIYDYDHQDDASSHEQSSNRPQSRASHNSENGYAEQEQYSRRAKDHHQYGGHSEQRDHDENEHDMW